jgi:integrase
MGAFMPRLTDYDVKNAKAANGKDAFLNDSGGLYLRVFTNTNAKAWLYRYKVGNKTSWIEIGRYSAMSLHQARARALNMTLLRKQGIDPVQQKARDEEARLATEEAARQAQAKAAARLTVNSLFSQWKSRELGQRKDGGDEVVRSFKKDVFPKIGDVAAEDVTRQMITGILDEVVLRGAPIIARNLLGDLRQMFGFAIARQVLQNDPTSGLKRNAFGKKVERDRVLSDAEIHELRAKLPAAKFQKSTDLALWIMLSTCCRVGELLQAQWCDIDLDAGTWHIPAGNSKNKKAHTVLLSSFSIEQFRALFEINGTSRWCYPAANNEDTHVDIKSASKQVGDRQRTTPMKNRSHATGALLLRGGKWTPHDLRRTGATMMGTLGVRPDVIEKCLNHVEQKKLVRIYQRQELKEEQRQAWRLLGERLEFLMAAKSNVIMLQCVV